jgi:hypothetical protein
MSSRADAQLSLGQLAYFRDRIEWDVNTYEEKVRYVDARYIAQVEKWARRTQDPAIANFYCHVMRPEQIRHDLRNVRWLLKTGAIAKAYETLEQLKAILTLVENNLRHQIFKTGLKQHRVLEDERTKTNANRKSKAARRHQQWRIEAQKVWERSSWLSVSACAKCVIKNLKIDSKKKTVADAIRDLSPKKRGSSPKKVGGAG